MLKPSLCYYCDAYILLKGPITFVGQGVALVVAAARNNKEKRLIREHFKQYTIR